MDGFDAMSALLGGGGDDRVEGDITEFDINLILENPYQPRKSIDNSYIDELAETIKAHGIMQPIVVRDSDDKPGHKVLIAGQRRLIAAIKAGLQTIPIITRNVGDDVAALMSIIENLQREGVPPIDTANALKVIKEKFGLSQREIAKSIGKSDKFVSDHLSIFKLPEVIFNALSTGKIESAQTAIELRKLFMLDEAVCLAALADSDFISYHEAVLLNRSNQNKVSSQIETVAEAVDSCDDEEESSEEFEEDYFEDKPASSKTSKNTGYSDSGTIEEVSFTEEEEVDREESKEFQHKVSIVVEILRNLKDRDVKDIAETIVSRLLD